MSSTAFLSYSIYTSAKRQRRVVSKYCASPGYAQSDRALEFGYGPLIQLQRDSTLR